MAGRPGSASFIDLDELLPDDLAFQIGGETFPVPGDVPVPTVLGLQRALAGLQDLEGTPADEEGTALVTEAVARVHQQVIALFGLRRADCAAQAEEEALAILEGRDPSADGRVLVLGMRGAVAIIEAVMKQMGATPVEEVAPEGGARPSRRGTTARSTTRTAGTGAKKRGR